MRNFAKGIYCDGPSVACALCCPHIEYKCARRALSSAHAETRLELDMYLQESFLPRTPSFDNLSWWKTNGLKFPTLKKMARDLLAIPVSTVASELAFSTSGRLVSPHRSRLHHTTLEALMCARTWLWNEINGLTSSIDKVSCPTLLDEEEEPDSSCRPFEMQ